MLQVHSLECISTSLLSGCGKHGLLWGWPTSILCTPVQQHDMHTGS